MWRLIWYESNFELKSLWILGRILVSWEWPPDDRTLFIDITLPRGHTWTRK